jgi:serralysin
MPIPTELELFLLQLINDMRFAYNDNQVTFEPELMAAASVQSEWMDRSDTISHTGENGSTLADRIAAEDYAWRSVPAIGDPRPTYAETVAFAGGPLTKETVLQLFNKLSNPRTLNNPDFVLMEDHKPDVGISLKEGTLNGETGVFATLVYAEPSLEGEHAEPDNEGWPTTPITAPATPSGVQAVLGTAGNDALHGTDGTNFLYGGSGNDTYYINQVGDLAIEAAAQGYDTAVSSVSYSLVSRSTTERYLTTSAVENLTLTGSADIDGQGNVYSNILTGNAGNNTLDCSWGTSSVGDRINGKGGQDVLIGSDGPDTYVFDTAAEANGDTIVDFVHAHFWGLYEVKADRIHLANIDANTLVGGNQAFTFIGTERFHKVAGELHVYHLADRNTYVSGDTDGDGRPEFAIKVLGWHTFDSSEFVL